MRCLNPYCPQTQRREDFDPGYVLGGSCSGPHLAMPFLKGWGFCEAKGTRIPRTHVQLLAHALCNPNPKLTCQHSPKLSSWACVGLFWYIFLSQDCMSGVWTPSVWKMVKGQEFSEDMVGLGPAGWVVRAWACSCRALSLKGLCKIMIVKFKYTGWYIVGIR